MDLNDLFSFEIKRVSNKRLQRLLLHKIDPTSATGTENLGTISGLAFRSAMILNSVNPRLRNPVILVFAGDHGVSQSMMAHLKEEDLTQNELQKFLEGTTRANIMAQASGIDIKLIDVSVNHSFEGTFDYWLHHGSKLINRKQAFGTRDFHEYPAMTNAELHASMQIGMEMVDKERKSGCNVVGFGQLGRGGRLSAWCLAAALLDKPLDTIAPKMPLAIFDYLDKSLKTHPKSHDVSTILCVFGGHEIAAIVAGIIRAAQNRMLILIDSLVGSVAALAASKIAPSVLDYCIFVSSTNDSVHALILDKLSAQPLLHLEHHKSMGTGIAFTYPLLKNAISTISNR